ncbi:unnamed protein product [Adineta steineri]|uniref:Uncharacterized protein n=1 Tax=Adineta steineri TaxID=433720 RepID=A0A814V1C0_9BILA|nr:unnamed protein product [Adineta steineri]CAF1416497.1 unnamed protein product [Adineta steineri]
MAMANNKTQCFTCNKEKITYPCKGCSKEFCLMDLTEYQRILSDELNLITNEYNEFKQRINEQKQNPQNDLLIKQIDEWEAKSIAVIQQKAQQCRKIAMGYLPTFLNDIEKKFNDLSQQIKQIHHENESNEINLIYLRNQLIEITQELNNPSKIFIKEDSQSFINEISIISSRESKFNKWKQNAIVVAGGNGQGQQLNQLFFPYEIFIDKKKNIIIADYGNNRIVEWKYNAKEGQIIAGRNQIDQLYRPTGMIVDQQNHSIITAHFWDNQVIRWMNQNQQILIDNIDCSRLTMDKNGFFYVSDWARNEVRRWKMEEYNNEGVVVAGGNGKGNQLNQLNDPTSIFVDEDQSVYISDHDNNRVMKWRKDAKEGTIVAGGNGQGRNLNQLHYPEGLFVDDLGQIYVADCWNHRVMRWCEGKEDGEIVVGGNGEGNQLNQLNQLNHPSGLYFDDERNLYVADRDNHRIQKFEIVL